ncbi:hypothetical protein AOCH_005759 [Aspergillus ochraceoroseus]|uniref:Uncharacterized protein n=2 Tax=Aspergillus subgen. Nidulantes TaxID=2720870 RepID=A0A0F8X208_9EURO|nr:hypothetical protein AOCH_005759 [Aspergillus ochraceoroseus]
METAAIPGSPPPSAREKETCSDTSDEEEEEACPVEVDVHGLKAKIYLNCADADIIPSRYLDKADRSHLVRRSPWVFRATHDGRQVNLNKWSKVDIRFRGVFRTLKRAPAFASGLYESTGEAGCLLAGGSSSSSYTSSFFFSSSSLLSSRTSFEDAVKAQAQVVYALIDEILTLLQITREAEDHRSSRLLSSQPEYWTGYRVKHRDTPYTAGSISVDYYPQRGTPRAVVPVSMTREQGQPLKSALEGKFKLLLAQLLVNVYRLSPPGDMIPDQEAFLIGLHGSRLHILRAIFPGQKTSKLWCGRYNPSMQQSAQPQPSKANERFYYKPNLERFLEQVEWSQLSNSENEADPRVFQVFGSREYDLWVKEEFSAALRLLVGLIMYLMSGQARCGILQDIFEQYPYDEDVETQGEDGKGTEKAAKEQKDVEEEEKKLKDIEKKKREEDQARVCAHEAMRTSTNDRIGGFEDFRQPCWDWVWDDGQDEELVKDDADIILRRP